MSTSKQTKLTLVVDPLVVRRAKSYASAHRTSVSSLVESFLKNLTSGDVHELTHDPESWPPTTRSLFGALADTGEIDTDELKLRHLREKYLHDERFP